MRIGWVTGAGAGLGREIALRLAVGGWQVHAFDRDADALATLDTAIATHHVDLGDREACRTAAAAALASAPTVDILVNCVGVAGPTATIEDLSLDDWDTTFAVNLISHVVFTQAVVPAMKAARRGAIVGISSTSATTGLPLRTPYVVSKAAVVSLTRNLARELGPYGIAVNAVLPGPMAGPRLDRVIDTQAAALGMTREAFEADMLRFISMRTTVTVGEVAALVLHLASDEGRRISGQAIAVDGDVRHEE